MDSKYIFLLRHGNAPKMGNETDKQRKLSELGKNEILQVVDYLQDRTKPEIIFASDAVRTRQTAEIYNIYSKNESVTKLNPVLYNCDPSDIISIITDVDSAYASLMIIGHNPSITNVIDSFDCSSKDKDLEVSARNYEPTAKLVVLKSKIASWNEATYAHWNIHSVFWPGVS